MKLAVIIPAAGFSGRYLGAGGVRSKLEEDLGGKPLLQRTVEVFTKFDDDDVTIDPILVAGPHEESALADFKRRHADRLSLLGARVVRGGLTHRWETVAAALEHVPNACTHIAVHDAARPCLSFELLGRILRAARKYSAVIPAISCPDTLKRVRETGEEMGGDDPVAAILGESAASKQPVREVLETLDRNGLVLVQTPQVFRAEVLLRAYEGMKSGTEAQAITDDASLVERLGERVVIVDGDARNLKVTLPGDLVVVRAILGVREPEGRPTHKKF